MKEIFEDIIKNNRWRRHPCGPGSTFEYTENLRLNLGNFLEKYKIESMIDAPCGDYSWMNHTTLPSIKTYIGGDIVDFLIEQNQKKYPTISFKVLDLTLDPLPTVDLLFCRDCLLHLSFENIDKVFKNISQSNVKYVLLSNWFDGAENYKDIHTGQVRCLNFLNAPYNFKNPIDSITDFVPGYPHREMMLWSKDTIDTYIKEKI